MKESDLFEVAASLFDCGWRADDRDELVQRYRWSEDVADGICDVLSDIEDAFAMAHLEEDD